MYLAVHLENKVVYVHVTLLKSLCDSVYISTYIKQIVFLCLVPAEQPPARSWISLQEPDRTRPSGKDNTVTFATVSWVVKCNSTNSVTCFSGLSFYMLQCYLQM